MHICFSTIDYHQKNGGGGVASYLDAISPTLIKLGHKVTIIGPGNEKKIFTNSNGVNIIQIPLGSFHWYLYRLKFPSWIYMIFREFEWSFSLYKTLKTINRNDPIDIIESLEIGISWLLLSSKNALPPIVVRLHGSPYIFKKYSGVMPNLGDKLNHKLEIWALKKANGISAPSIFQSKEYEKRINRKIEHIPNPIGGSFLTDLEKFDQTERVQNGKILLYTGRIAHVKGVLVLIKAIEKVKRKFPEIKLIIAGGHHNSISKKKLIQTINNAKVKENLELLGHVPYKEIKLLYQKANIFVMPSYYETFGISVIEAMAFSLPIIATSSGALPELVDNKVNGLIVPSGDENALANAIISILDNESTQVQMGSNGKNKVIQNYTPFKVANRTLNYYKSVIDRNIHRKVSARTKIN